MKNNVIIIIDANGSLLSEPIGQLRANANYTVGITVLAPFDLTTIVSANFKKNNRREKDIANYLIPTSYKGKDIITDVIHPLYQKVYNYNVWENTLTDDAVAYVATFVANMLYASIGFDTKQTPALATTYLGEFGIGIPLPLSANNGDYLISNSYNYYQGGINYTLGDYAYWYNDEWNKSNYIGIAGTDSFPLSVSPNIKANYEITENVDLSVLLAGRVAVLEQEVQTLADDLIDLEIRVSGNEQDIDTIKLKDVEQDNRLDIIESDIEDIEDVDRNQNDTLQDHDTRITKNTQDINEINESLTKIDGITITRNDDQELEVSALVLDDIESRVLKNEFETWKITNNNKINAVENGLQIQIDEMEFVVDITLVGNNIKVEHRDGDVTYIPVNEAVESGYYDTNTKELVLELANGNEIRIPSGDIVAGLASVDYVDTGLALKENKSNKITELVGVPNNTQYMSAKLTNDLIMAARTEFNSLLDGKQDKLVVGDNITIDENNVISTSGGDGIDLDTFGYMDYAADIYYKERKQSLFENAWEHSLTVKTVVRANYPNGETEGIIIPQSVTTIVDNAFRNWDSNNQPLVIPNSIIDIGSYAFSNWTSNNQPLVIPDSVTSIGGSAFADWQSNNQPLIIPNSVTSIENGAFRSWEANNQPLVIPDSVTSISFTAFYNWISNNQPLIIPNSVTYWCFLSMVGH